MSTNKKLNAPGIEMDNAALDQNRISKLLKCNFIKACINNGFARVLKFFADGRPATTCFYDFTNEYLPLKLQKYIIFNTYRAIENFLREP